LSVTSTQIKLAFGFKEQTMTGTGFTFGGLNGIPSAGTITSASFSGLDSAGMTTVVHGSVTGLSANLATWYNALHPNDTAATENTFHAAMGVLLSGADTFNGSTGNDSVYGYNGNDILKGNAGNDFGEGGLGDDTINGGTGFDIAGYSRTTAAVTVNLAIAAQQNTVAAGLDTLTSIEGLMGSNYNDTLLGNNYANKLLGGAGNDTLKGLGGNDIIDGGAGNDLITGGTGRDGLIGGTGRDTFIYTALSESLNATTRDLIVDFTPGTLGDILDLRLIDANTAVIGDQAFSATIKWNTASFTAAAQLREMNGVLYGNTDANFSTAEFVIDIDLYNPGAIVVGSNFLL
jgi:serralysin